jgi:hypothetical protein
MYRRKAIFNALLLLFLGLMDLQAQESIAATGSNASGSGGTANYTVGLVTYRTNIGSGGSEAQGVEHAFEIFVITGLEEAKGITLLYSIYPNPATDILILKIEGELQTQYVVSLFDINGIRLENKKIEGVETSFVMKNLIPGTYFLKVTNNNQEVKAFKIIKK